MTLPGEISLSIIILTHQRAALLSDCLESLLSQDIPRDSIELIVVDDGSSDETPQVVENFQARHPRILYCYQNHSGIPAARNLGIRASSAERVAIVADDYILPPNYARTILEFFEEHPEAEVVRFRVVASRENLASRLSHFYYEISCLNRLYLRPAEPGFWAKFQRYSRKITLPEPVITAQHQLEAAGAAAFKRAVFDRAGLFDEKLQRGEDTDFTRRLRSLEIPIYYNPFLEIRHQYGPWCLDTLQKCYQSGVNQYRLAQKYEGRQSLAGQIKFHLKNFLGKLARSTWGARHAGKRSEVFLFLPGLLLFELAMKVGFARALLQEGLLRRKPASQVEEESNSRAA